MNAMEVNMRRMKMIILIMTVCVCMVACQKAQEEMLALEEIETQVGETVEAAQESEAYIYVYVCGAVNCEGVYELPVGSRVYEAIEMAGGFREDAAGSEVNQAEVLEDATRLYIPTVSEAAESQSVSDGKININKATKEELMTLPGVGSSRADSIIQYREEVSAFKSIEDIMLVSGIKEGLFEKIKDFIKIN